MPGIRHPLMINGMPVLTAPADIDVATADQLRAALLHAGDRGHTTIVIDMTRTRFCDSAGLTVLVRAHKRAMAEGGELRLIIATDGAVAQIFAITRLDLVIPLFASLDDALAITPATVIRPLRPWPSAGAALSGSPACRTGCELVTHDRLEAAVAAGQSGPVITLTGEIDLMSVAELSALLSGQLTGGTTELTIDASGLRFADSASIRALLPTARTLRKRADA